jgi:hypothetical protein
MAKNFKSNVGGKVSKAEAMKWIEKYDKEMRADKTKDTKSIFYGRDMLLEILNKEGCAGITFFLALKHSEFAKKETVSLVLVPTKEDGTQIWPEDSSSPAARIGGGEVMAFDNGAHCPPYC